MRRLLVFLVLCSACGPLTSGKDAGSGGGGGSIFTGGGLGGGTTGGGTTGGGTGGGGVTGGGATGGGSTGGGGATGGGGTTGGGGGAPGPLRWASISLGGVTGSGPIIAISGTATDLYALQDNGNLYHSTGGAFSLVTQFSGGVKALHVEGSLIVVLRYRAILWCSSNCTSTTAFSSIDLVSPGLDSEAACGSDASHIAVIVSDVNSNGQLYEWNGSTFTRTNNNLGLHYPRSCWYSNGKLFVGGENKVIVVDQGAATPETLYPMGSTTLYGGFGAADAEWASGQSGALQRRVGGTWSELTTNTNQTLWTVGGPSANEIYVFGYYTSPQGNGFKWNGTTLSPAGDLLPGAAAQSTIQCSLVTGPDEMYAGGSNQSGPLVVRGRR